MFVSGDRVLADFDLVIDRLFAGYRLRIVDDRLVDALIVRAVEFRLLFAADIFLASAARRIPEPGRAPVAQNGRFALCLQDCIRSTIIAPLILRARAHQAGRYGDDADCHKREQRKFERHYFRLLKHTIFYLLVSVGDARRRRQAK